MPISSFPISVKSSINLSDINIDSDLDLGENNLILNGNLVLDGTPLTLGNIATHDKDLNPLLSLSLVDNFKSLAEQYNSGVGYVTYSTTLTDLVEKEYILQFIIDMKSGSSSTNVHSNLTVNENLWDSTTGIPFLSKTNTSYKTYMSYILKTLKTGDVLRIIISSANPSYYCYVKNAYINIYKNVL